MSSGTPPSPGGTTSTSEDDMFFANGFSMDDTTYSSDSLDTDSLPTDLGWEQQLPLTDGLADGLTESATALPPLAPTSAPLLPASVSGGEGFAAGFLSCYVGRDQLPTTQGASLTLGSASDKVWGFVPGPPLKKWGLAHELPAGWYLMDAAPRNTFNLLDVCDTSASSPCVWKTTGRQIARYDASAPVQIRYCSPKADSCSRGYASMRAAIYTWCVAAEAPMAHGQQPGWPQESSQYKLIHVYTGRAAKAPRRRTAAAATPRAIVKTDKDGGARAGAASSKQSFNLSEAALAHAVQSEQISSLLGEAIDALRAKGMTEAALVVEVVLAKKFASQRDASAPSGDLAREIAMARVVMQSLEPAELQVRDFTLKYGGFATENNELLTQAIPAPLRRQLDKLCGDRGDSAPRKAHVLILTAPESNGLEIENELSAIYERVKTTEGHPDAVAITFTVLRDCTTRDLWAALSQVRARKTFPQQVMLLYFLNERFMLQPGERFTHLQFSGHGDNADGDGTLRMPAGAGGAIAAGASASSGLRRRRSSRSNALAACCAKPVEEELSRSTSGGSRRMDAPVDDQAFAEVIAEYHHRTPLADGLQCVVLSACHTTSQGRALVEQGIPCVCFNDGPVSSHVAREFSAVLYEQVALGKDVAAAHRQAVTWCRLNVQRHAWVLSGVSGLRVLTPLNLQGNGRAEHSANEAGISEGDPLLDFGNADVQDSRKAQFWGKVFSPWQTVRLTTWKLFWHLRCVCVQPSCRNGVCP